MKTKKVISYDNLPIKLPLTSSLVFWLMLDRYDAPGWLYGVFWTMVVLLIIGFVISFVWLETTEDIFK